eukprot:45679-Rhodomonas_salina.1
MSGTDLARPGTMTATCAFYSPYQPVCCAHTPSYIASLSSTTRALASTPSGTTQCLWYQAFYLVLMSVPGFPGGGAGESSRGGSRETGSCLRMRYAMSGTEIAYGKFRY